MPFSCEPNGYFAEKKRKTLQCTMVVAPAGFIKSGDRVKSGDEKNVRMQQRGDETVFFRP
jgi:hypothetical protein